MEANFPLKSTLWDNDRSNSFSIFLPLGRFVLASPVYILLDTKMCQNVNLLSNTCKLL